MTTKSTDEQAAYIPNFTKFITRRNILIAIVVGMVATNWYEVKIEAQASKLYDDALEWQEANNGVLGLYGCDKLKQAITLRNFYGAANLTYAQKCHLDPEKTANLYRKVAMYDDDSRTGALKGLENLYVTGEGLPDAKTEGYWMIPYAMGRDVMEDGGDHRWLRSALILLYSEKQCGSHTNYGIPPLGTTTTTICVNGITTEDKPFLDDRVAKLGDKTISPFQDVDYKSKAYFDGRLNEAAMAKYYQGKVHVRDYWRSTPN